MLRKQKELAKTQEQHKQNLVLIAAILAVGIVLAVLFTRSPKSSDEQKEAAGPVPVYASYGELATGFPKELVLDGAASVESSYTIAYDASVNQHTAVFMSDESPVTLRQQYKQYFADNGWKILSETTEGIQALYAQKDRIDASFTAGLQDGRTQVIIAYLEK